MGCRLKKSIYGLKQPLRQWYLKFNKMKRKFGFKENIEDNCVCAKFKNGKYIFLILYVDDVTDQYDYTRLSKKIFYRSR
jgi:hypothetical protein